MYIYVYRHWHFFVHFLSSAYVCGNACFLHMFGNSCFLHMAFFFFFFPFFSKVTITLQRNERTFDVALERRISVANPVSSRFSV